MDHITHVQTFAAVVRAGSFSDAARALGVVPSLVAKRIAALEGQLQTRLFHRTTRQMRLTAAGEKFQARSSHLLLELQELFDALEHDDSKLEGHIRLMAPTTLGIEKLGPMLNAFLFHHPRISLDITLIDRSINPAEEGFDLAISGRLASYQGVVDVPLWPVRPLLCAAPAYLQQYPPLEHPRDLVHHQCLVFSPTGADWQFQSSRGLISVEVMPRMKADDNVTLRTAAIAGLGVAILPTYVVQDALEQGQLTTLLGAFPPQENWFKAYIPKRQTGVTRVKALIDWLRQQGTELNPEALTRP